MERQDMPADGRQSVAVVRFDLRARAAEAFGVFSSLAEFSDALGAWCLEHGHRPTGPISVDEDGRGSVDVAGADGRIVAEFHLIAGDGSRYGPRGGVAGFSLCGDREGAIGGVYPCGIYASEAEVRGLAEFERRFIKGSGDVPSRWLIVPFSGVAGDRRDR